MDEVTFGPMQLLVIVFDDPDFHGQIRRELESVLNKEMIRLIDLLFVLKDEEGNIKSMEAIQLDEEKKTCCGAVIGGLIWYGTCGGEEVTRECAEAAVLAAAAQENYGITEKDIMGIIEAIPEDTAAAVLIVEHIWAKNLKKAIHDAGGILTSQGMLTPELLSAVGLHSEKNWKKRLELLRRDLDNSHQLHSERLPIP